MQAERTLHETFRVCSMKVDLWWAMPLCCARLTIPEGHATAIGILRPTGAELFKQSVWRDFTHEMLMAKQSQAGPVHEEEAVLPTVRFKM